MRNDSFMMTGILTEKIEHKIDFVSVETTLNKYLYLKTYGSSIKNIFFAYIIMPKHYHFHPEDLFYDTQTCSIHLCLKLFEEKIVHAKDLSESLLLMATLFYESIPTYYPTFNIPDFNWQQFALDVKLLFIRKNWLDLSLTMVEKEQFTGLTISQMELIEQTPKQARMGDLLAYCKGLRIDYKILIPELKENFGTNQVIP